MCEANLIAPHDERDKHESGRRPRQRQKLVPAVRIHADIVAILVDHVGALDRDSGDERARKPDGEERENGDHEVEAGGKAAVGEDSGEGSDESDEDEGDGDAVQNEGGLTNNTQGVQAALNIFGPLEVLQCDACVGVVERFLQDVFGIKPEHRGAVGAAGHVLGNVTHGSGGIGCLERGVLAEAVVEEVG